ncbi:unnamed protein product [Larinioides sclopetarius]|uniref:Uncharacterized protein n=1 Tax=Larinioides sclopetarius TaxID=280406 RepID=A0AAV2AFL5_9ARAC
MNENNLNVVYQKYFSKKEADQIFEELEREIEYFPSEMTTVVVFNKRYPVPRKVSAYGDKNLTYTFSGNTLPTKPLIPILDPAAVIYFVRDMRKQNRMRMRPLIIGLAGVRVSCAALFEVRYGASRIKAKGLVADTSQQQRLCKTSKQVSNYYVKKRQSTLIRNAFSGISPHQKKGSSLSLLEVNPLRGAPKGHIISLQGSSRELNTPHFIRIPSNWCSCLTVNSCCNLFIERIDLVGCAG